MIHYINIQINVEDRCTVSEDFSQKLLNDSQFLMFTDYLFSRDLNEIQSVMDTSNDDSLYYELSMNAINSSAASK